MPFRARGTAGVSGNGIGAIRYAEKHCYTLVARCYFAIRSRNSRRVKYSAVAGLLFQRAINIISALARKKISEGIPRDLLHLLACASETILTSLLFSVKFTHLHLA